MDILLAARPNPGKHDRGDIIDIRPTGKELGGREAITPANGGIFATVHLVRDDGVTPVWAKGDPIPARARELQDVARDVGGAITLARVWNVVAASLPQAVQDELWNTGAYTVKWSTVKAFVQHKITLVNPDDTVIGL